MQKEKMAVCGGEKVEKSYFGSHILTDTGLQRSAFVEGLSQRRSPAVASRGRAIVQVSQEFADFMVQKVLTARQLWDALLSGSRCSAFWRLLTLRVDSALGVAPDGGVPNVLGMTLYQVLGPEDWEWVRTETVARLRTALPEAVQAPRTRNRTRATSPPAARQAAPPASAGSHGSHGLPLPPPLRRQCMA